MKIPSFRGGENSELFFTTQDCKLTAEMLRKFRRCFDIFNHTDNFLNKSNFGEQKKELCELIDYMENVIVHMPKSSIKKVIKHKEHLPFQKGFIMNCRALISLCEITFEKFPDSELSTHSLTADSIEVANGCLRAFSNRKPGKCESYSYRTRHSKNYTQFSFQAHFNFFTTLTFCNILVFAVSIDLKMFLKTTAMMRFQSISITFWVRQWNSSRRITIHRKFPKRRRQWEWEHLMSCKESCKTTFSRLRR